MNLKPQPPAKMTSSYKSPYQVDVRVPDGETEHWKIETFTVDEYGAKFDALRNIVHGSGRGVPTGTYKRLVRKNEWFGIVMSNTPDEIRDHRVFIQKAEGDVLINGLGLGVILEILLPKPKITSITVIEKDEEVISLVAPSFENEEKLIIINADALEYTPPKGRRYNAVWHDIWDGITTDNLEDMKKLHRRYGRRCDWQGSWARWMCEDHARKEKRNYY